MKRLICIASIGYILGIILRLYFSSITFLIALLCIFWLIKKDKKIIILLVFVILSFIYIDILENEYNRIENKQIEEKAVIISDIQEKEYKYIYEAKFLKNNKKVLISIKKSQQIDKINYGDLIYLEGKLEIPKIATNYKGFNYRQYLKTQKIQGIVIADNVKILKAKYKNNLIYQIQKKIKTIIKEKLPSETGDLLLAILLGDKKDLSEQIQINFKNSNLSHMLAVSGAHVSYIIVGLTYITQNSIMGKRKGRVFCIFLLIIFMAITNFTPSVTRACIMAILTLVSEILYKKADIYTNISISALIILLYNPYSLLDLGFKLSFGGTIGIIIFMRFIKKKQEEPKLLNYIKQMALVSICANIIIIPIIMNNFNTVSLTFLVSNILASPILAIIVIVGFSIIIISIISHSLSNLLVFWLNPILNLLIKISSFCSKLPFAKILVVTPYIFNIIFYYTIILYLVNYNKIKQFIKKKTVILLSIILILSNFIFYILPQDLKIYFIDVGQGDSTLIVTPSKKTILIDGGGSESFDVGEKVLLPYLLGRRIRKIDYIMISHFDTDHCKGIFTVIENLKVKNIIISKQAEKSENYKKFKEIVANKKINIILVKAGDKIKIDKYIYFKILFPTEKLIMQNPLNNNSMVSKLNYKSFKMLFTGDIEEIAEKEILNLQKDKLKSTILKVAHHGSNTSSTQEFINSVKPELALIGVGKNNTFGHPSECVVEKLRDLRY
ncbi:MAG: DNA internalization-related competence protein ComEC/Rec2 [Clostridia bacterium]